MPAVPESTQEREAKAFCISFGVEFKPKEQLGEGQSRAHSWLGWISSETVEFLICL